MKKWQITILLIFSILLQGVFQIPFIKYSCGQIDIEHYIDKSGYNEFADKIPKSQYFKITNQEELDLFKILYIDCELKKDYDLSKNTLFIKYNFVNDTVNDYLFFGAFERNKSVEFSDFCYSFSSTSLCLSGYNYYVAVIPNWRLKKLNLAEWKSPFELFDSDPKYCSGEFYVECEELEFGESYTIIEESIKNIEGIRLNYYSDSQKQYKITTKDGESIIELKRYLQSKNESISIEPIDINSIIYNELDLSKSNINISLKIKTQNGSLKAIADSVNGTISSSVYSEYGPQIDIENRNINEVITIINDLSNNPDIENLDYTLKWINN